MVYVLLYSLYILYADDKKKTDSSAFFSHNIHFPSRPLAFKIYHTVKND